MRSSVRILALLVTLGLVSCASEVPVSVSFDPIERFPAEARWRWDDPRIVLPEDERIAAMQLGPVVKDVVAAELDARGYRAAGSSLPDYLLSFHLGMTTRIRPEGSFAVGSLSVLIREAKSGRQVWMGFAQAEVDVSRSEPERRTRLRKIVQEMFRNFPPGSDERDG